MPENPEGLAPLRWKALVEEAIRRRRSERLTQRDHAALAGVSVPTLAAFDRGEKSLSLAKAFDILDVVGLLEGERHEDAQEAFVQASMDGWRRLTDPLPETSPARFPHGSINFDYYLAGDLKSVALDAFEAILRKTMERITGWPVFMVLDRSAYAPRVVEEGAVECWLGRDDGFPAVLNDAAHCDYWRALPTGRMFLMRGYQEDGQETFAPGTVMDSTLPIWRIGETLLHAARLSTALGRGKGQERPKIHFRAVYSGMSGRVLRSWANPFSDLVLEGHGARSDEAVLATTLGAEQIENDLATCVLPLVSSLYDRFGMSGLSLNRVAAEIERMIKARNP